MKTSEAPGALRAGDEVVNPANRQLGRLALNLDAIDAVAFVVGCLGGMHELPKILAERLFDFLLEFGQRQILFDARIHRLDIALGHQVAPIDHAQNRQIGVLARHVPLTIVLHA